MNFSHSPLLLAAIAISGSVAAQEQPSQRLGVLEEIIVTAQKRDESLQDVPISMQVVTGEYLGKMEIQDLSVLSHQLPNVNISKGTVSNNIYMRGIGSGNNGGFEQSVGTFVDGVYHGRSRLSESLIVDVAQLEVLRGPQSIYFGNNSIGGAFSVSTRRPTDTFEGYVKTSYEFEAEQAVLEAAASGPLTDSISFRVASRYSDSNGYLKNEGTGESNTQEENKFLRGWLRWDISDTWQTSFKAVVADQRSTAPFPQQLVDCPAPEPFLITGACAIALAMGTNTELDDTRSSLPGERGSLDAEEYVWNVEGTLAGGASFASTLAYSEHSFHLSGDSSGIPTNYYQYATPEEYDQTSLELRLASPTESRLSYIVGAYFLESNLEVPTVVHVDLLNDIIPFVAPPLTPFLPLGGSLVMNQEESQQSVFGALTWAFTDALSVTAGVRWIRSDKDGEQSATNVTSGSDFGVRDGTELPDELQGFAALFTGITKHSSKGSISDTDTLPSLTIRYAPGDAVSYYASASRGFKSGGFDATELSGVDNRFSYDPETVDAYEVGLKSVLLENTLSLNLAVFHSEYSDLQQSATQITETSAFIFVTNVEGLNSSGIELDAIWQIADNWNLTANLAYLDAEYEGYTNGGCTSLQRFSQPVGCVQDLDGAPPPFAPEYSGSVSLTYDAPLTQNLQLSSSVRMNFSDDYFLDSTVDSGLAVDSYQTYDLYVGLGDTVGLWEVALIGRNLGDEDIATAGNAAIGTLGSYSVTRAPGRTVILQATYNW